MKYLSYKKEKKLMKLNKFLVIVLKHFLILDCTCEYRYFDIEIIINIRNGIFLLILLKLYEFNLTIFLN